MSTDDGNSASKRSRNQQVDDRISDLPESVLLHILSFLSAIYVVRTSVLSRRWQYVWTGVPWLDFGGELVRELRGREKAVNFVNRFLFQYKAASIYSFTIESTISNSSDTELWIRWAINRNVAELDISFSNKSPSHHLPQTIFGCRTLVFLRLEGPLVGMAFPPSACIPCLKTLELISVSSPDEEFENKLISCCLVSGKHSLLLANVGNLSKAEISLNDSKAFQSLLKFFSALENVKRLLLTSPDTKQACILEPGPVVHNVNLTHLALGVRSVWAQLLPYFLHCFPNLEALELDKDSSVCEDAGKLCTEPKLLPTGLVSHLTLFVAEEFSGTNDELDMLEYILKNGKDLDLVRIMHCCSSQIAKEYTTRKGTKAREFEEKLIACKEESRKHELKLRVAQKILDFPRASQTCRIEFSDAV